MTVEVPVGDEGLQGQSEEWKFHPLEEGESYGRADVDDVNQEDVANDSFSHPNLSQMNGLKGIYVDFMFIVITTLKRWILFFSVLVDHKNILHIRLRGQIL